MPQVSQKNFPLTGAATDLGLGDMVGEQLSDEEKDRRKKLMQSQAMGMNQAMGAASMSLLGGYR